MKWWVQTTEIFQSVGLDYSYRGSMSANEGINKERRKQEIKETVDLTQKRDQENSYNDGK